jgi:hypothetical protein
VRERVLFILMLRFKGPADTRSDRHSEKTPPILPKRSARYSSYRRASYSRSEKIAAQEFQTAPQGKKDEAEPLS